MSSYPALIAADSPYAYWKLSEPSGTAAADTASTHSGTYSGGFTLGAGGAAGDSSVAFDGSSGCMTVASTSGITWATSPMSMECWYYLAALPGDADPRPFMVPSFTGTGDLGHGLGLNLDGANSGKLQYGYYSNGTGWKTVSLASSPSLNQWHHAVGTYNGTTLILYHDGVQAATSNPSPALGGALQAAFYFGRAWDTSRTHNFTAVSLCQAAYYLSVLSAAKVAARYAAGRPVRPLVPSAALSRAATR